MSAVAPVVALLVTRTPNGTCTVQYSGRDRDAVERDALAAWHSIDTWQRGPMPAVSEPEPGLFAASVTRYSAE